MELIIIYIMIALLGFSFGAILGLSWCNQTSLYNTVKELIN